MISINVYIHSCLAVAFLMKFQYSFKIKCFEFIFKNFDILNTLFEIISNWLFQENNIGFLLKKITFVYLISTFGLAILLVEFSLKQKFCIHRKVDYEFIFKTNLFY